MLKDLVCQWFLKWYAIIEDREEQPEGLSIFKGLLEMPSWGYNASQCL